MKTGASKNLLLEMLKIINFKDDKETFVNEFQKNVRLQSLLDLVQSLPPASQKKAQEQLSNSNDPGKVASTIKEYFSQTQMARALEIAANNAVVKYIEAINPTLSPTQRQQLAKMFRELRPETSG